MWIAKNGPDPDARCDTVVTSASAPRALRARRRAEPGPAIANKHESTRARKIRAHIAAPDLEIERLSEHQSVNTQSTGNFFGGADPSVCACAIFASSDATQHAPR